MKVARSSLAVGHLFCVQVGGCGAQFIWRYCPFHLAAVSNWLVVSRLLRYA